MTRIVRAAASLLIYLALSACSGSDPNADIEALAISQAAEEMYQDMRGYDPNLTLSSVRTSIKGAEVISNDGVTAVVRVEIKVRRDLPSDFVEVEVEVAAATSD